MKTWFEDQYLSDVNLYGEDQKQPLFSNETELWTIIETKTKIMHVKQYNYEE